MQSNAYINGWLIFFLLKAGYIFLIMKYTPYPRRAKNFLHQKIDQHPIPYRENGPKFLLPSLATDPYRRILSLIFIVERQYGMNAKNNRFFLLLKTAIKIDSENLWTASN